jgi:hypothetical protein
MEVSKGMVVGSLALLCCSALCCASAARAEYRCDPPPTDIDEIACKKAAEGPQELRRFIERMRPIENLYFFDYVNEKRLIEWRAMERKAEPPVLTQQAQRSDCFAISSQR